MEIATSVIPYQIYFTRGISWKSLLLLYHIKSISRGNIVEIATSVIPYQIYFTRGISRKSPLLLYHIKSISRGEYRGNRHFCYTISNLFHEGNIEEIATSVIPYQIYFTRGISRKSPLLLYHIKSISRGEYRGNRHFCYTISNLFHEGNIEEIATSVIPYKIYFTRGIFWKSPLLLYHIKSISRGEYSGNHHFCYTISNLFHEGNIEEIATSVIPYQIYFTREYRGNRHFCYTVSNLFHEGNIEEIATSVIPYQIYFTREYRGNRHFCYTVSNLFREGISRKSPLLLYHIKSISRGEYRGNRHFCYTISNLFHEGNIEEIATSVIPYQIYFTRGISRKSPLLLYHIKSISRGEYSGNHHFCYTI